MYHIVYLSEHWMLNESFHIWSLMNNNKYNIICLYSIFPGICIFQIEKKKHVICYGGNSRVNSNVRQSQNFLSYFEREEHRINLASIAKYRCDIFANSWFKSNLKYIYVNDALLHLRLNPKAHILEYLLENIIYGYISHRKIRELGVREHELTYRSCQMHTHTHTHTHQDSVLRCQLVRTNSEFSDSAERCTLNISKKSVQKKKKKTAA